MTDITDPGSINNGDTPDWDVLQTYFDAIYSVVNNPGQLDNNNIKAAAAIAYSKLNLTGAILNADLAGSISATKLARSTVHSDNSSALTNITPTTWTTTNTTFTAGATGLYVISCSGQVVNNAASNGYIEHQSRLLAGISVIGMVLVDRRWMDTSTVSLSVPFTHSVITPLTSGDIVNHQIYSDSVGSDVAAAGFNITAFCVQA